MMYAVILAAALAASDLNSGMCTTAPRLPLPPVDFAMEFKFGFGDANGSGSETIKAVTPLGATFVRAIDVPDGGRREMPPETSVFALFPLSNAHGRSKTYDVDPAAALVGLRIGETATVAFSETFAVDGKTHKRDSAAEVTFLGCSTIDIAGAPEPVLNYRVSTDSFVMSASDKKVSPLARSSTYSISQNYGWRIREQGSDGFIEATKISLR